MPDKILFYQLNIDCRKSVELFSGIACYTIHCIELFFRYGLWQSIAQKFLLPSKNFLKTIYLVCVHPMLGFLWSYLHLWCVCLLICVFYCGVQQDLKSFKIYILKFASYWLIYLWIIRHSSRTIYVMERETLNTKCMLCSPSSYHWLCYDWYLNVSSC